MSVWSGWKNQTAVIKKSRVKTELKPLESDIQKQIIDYCEATGVYVMRMQVGAAMYTSGDKWIPRKSTMTGFPDLLVIDNGNVFFFEVKTAKGRLQPSQVREHARLQQAKANVYVVRSLDEVIQVLKSKK